MKKIFTTLLALLLVGIGNALAKDCKVTYVEDPGLVLGVMDFSFNSVENGGTVPEGTNLMIILSCRSGYSLKSFTINGEDCMNKLDDQEGIGKDFQYFITITEDIHIDMESEVLQVPVLSNVSGDGKLEMYCNETLLESGDKVEYGSTVTVKAVPNAGSSIVKFQANDTDYLSDLLMNGNELPIVVYEKTTFLAIFTGSGTSDDECAVAWNVAGEGRLDVRCSGEEMNSGDKVVKGDYIDIRAIAAEGYSLTSFTINGEDRTQDLKDVNKLTVQVKDPMTLNAIFEADAPDMTWNELAADAFAGGDGTEQSPYLIETPEQLAKIANDVHLGNSTYSGVYFELAADIDLAGNNWLPIGYNMTGNSNIIFDGHFEGNGHKIMNLTVQPYDDKNSSGLFGATGSNFTLRNLTIESGVISGTAIVGALVGYNRGLIENCVNKAEVECVTFYCGGIVGFNSKGKNNTPTVRRCVNYGEITAGGSGVNGMSAGGIAGANSALIEECANYGTVTAPTSIAGGIVATFEGGEIRHCFNRGAVSSDTQVGGIVGSITGRDGDCKLYNCYSASQLESYSENQAGGVFGNAIFTDPNALEARDCYYDNTIFSGSGMCWTEDLYGKFTIENLTGLSTDEMKSADFVERLNNETKGDVKWAVDTNNENDGYPVLSDETSPSGINTVKADGITVYSSDGMIYISGAEADTRADVYQMSGNLVYTGNVASMQSRTFATGLYIVRISGNAYKVIVK